MAGTDGRMRHARRRTASNPSGTHRLLLTLALAAALLACRPCHGHDPELVDLDEEDGAAIVGTDTVVQLPGPLTHVTSVVKGKTDLPCDITPPVENDQASLVLFYKDDASPSIYTYDARDKYANRPKTWSDEQVLGKRAYFNAIQQPAGLVIDNVRESDAGLYRCRVDFKRSPTRNSRVNLTVVVPPKQIKLTDAKGVDVDEVIGPFDEDSPLALVCVVIGGNPRPEVTWWHEESRIDRHPETEKGAEVRNVLQIAKLTRSFLRTMLTCQATNTPLSHPLTKSVQIELNLKPLDVRILSSKQPLSAGKRYEVTCQTSGSRPAPTVTWYKNGQLLRLPQETQQFDGGNITLSTIALTLRPDDDGAKILCRAENAHLGPASAIEDTWVLDVYYVPKAQLVLGRNLSPDHIREGIDVYFDCHVEARPSAVRLVWRHQGNVLQHNVSAGVIVSETSLVLQRVSRHATGRYTCHAINTEGEGSSGAFQLNVLHKPVCRGEQKSVYGGAKGLTSEIECHVESRPGATSFRWAFNGTGELVDIASGYRTTADGSISILRYTPRSELDFGTLLCWASNAQGVQSQPCIYQLNPAGAPEPPNNCTISNQTLSSFEIDCAEGYDGGIPQHFKMHVFDMRTRTLLANLTSSAPRFALHLGAGGAAHQPAPGDETPRTHSWKSTPNNANSLPTDGDGSNKTIRRHSVGNGGSPTAGSGNIYGSVAVIPAVGTLLQVTAVNAYGVSESVFIEATSSAVVGLLPPEMQAGAGLGGTGSNFEFSPTLGILIGIVATGVVMMGALIAGIRFRQTKKPAPAAALKEKDRDLDSYNGNEYIELGTKDPDLIGMPDKAGSDPMPHITNNPLDLMTNGRPGSSTSTLPCRTDSPGPSSSGMRSSQEEVVYAELSLSRHRSAHLAVPASKSPAPEIGDGVVYAQIDHTKRKTKPAPPPPSLLGANHQLGHLSPLQMHPTKHTSIRMPDVSQTLTVGGGIRETTLM